MNRRRLRFLGVAALLALALAWPLAHQARSQINTAPTLQAVGVSASGNTSTAWFHEPQSRQVVACQAVLGQGSSLAGVQCTTARLP